MFEELEENQPKEKNEPEENDEQPANYTGLIIFICTLPLVLLFTHFGKFELGLNVGICVDMLTLAVGLCWDLKRYYWFWVTVALLLAIHVPVVLLIQWPHWWVSRIVLLPIGLADVLIDVGTIRFVEKFIVRLPPTEDEA